MYNVNNTHEIRQILYTLKRQFGLPIGLYYRNPDSVNLQTGDLTIKETKYPVRKAIVLPFNIFLKMFRHYGERKFEYAGDMSIERRVFIIDRRDIRNVTITNDVWFIIYNHKRYSIELMENFEYQEAYFITGKELPNTQTCEQIDVSLTDWVYPNDQALQGNVITENINDNISLSDNASSS